MTSLIKRQLNDEESNKILESMGLVLVESMATGYSTWSFGYTLPQIQIPLDYQIRNIQSLYTLLYEQGYKEGYTVGQINYKKKLMNELPLTDKECMLPKHSEILY